MKPIRFATPLLASLLGGLIYLLIAGCAPAAIQPTPTPVAIPEVTINAADFSFEMPDTLTTGWVRLKLVNVGKEPHHVVFRKLNEGVTLAQFNAALTQGEGPAFAVSTGYGGVGTVVPNTNAQAVVKLDAGQYVLLCLVVSPSDGKPHTAKGMTKPITVKAASGASPSEPVANVSAKMTDFAYDVPDSFSAGHITFKAVNNGTQDHEMLIAKVNDPSKTVSDIVQFAIARQGPPPFVSSGGLNLIAKSRTGFAEADLQPGRYMLFCMMPDPNKNGARHITLGMIKEITVK